MSAAASALRKPKPATQGWCKVPNSLIENSRGLTAAEFQLALMVIRKNGELPITDDSWTNWTGLSERTLEYAVAGLTKKGLLTAIPGKKSKYYSFETGNWQKYVETLPPAQDRPKTEGRKPVKPVAAKPGAMVHPECAHECAMLKQDRAETRGGLQLVPGPSAQPVAQKIMQDVEIITSGSATNGGGFGGNDSKSLKQLRRESPSFAPPIAQPVAQIDQYAAAWPLSLRTLQAIFPEVNTPFLVQLISAVRVSGFQDVDDEELTTAIQRAWDRKRKGPTPQTSEGLFLLTVPEAVRVLRATPKRDVETEQLAEVQRQHHGAQVMMARVSEVLHEKGFDKPAARLDALRSENNDLSVADMEALENQLSIIETEIVAVCHAHMTAAEKTECAAMVERVMNPYRDKMTDKAREEQRKMLSDRGAMNAMGIPRLSLFYV